jgi:hypothetical protein
MNKTLFSFTILVLISISNPILAQFDPIDWKNSGVDVLPNPKDLSDINPFPVIEVPAVECETNYTWKPTENFIPVWMKDK